jgi:hypothetical protein
MVMVRALGYHHLERNSLHQHVPFMTQFDSKTTLQIILRGSFFMSDTYFHDLVAK